VAPPSWVLCCFSGVQFGWPGLGGFHSRSEMRFFRPVRLGDRIVPSSVYEGYDGPHPSSFAGRAITDRIRNRYETEDGTCVCDFLTHVVRFERGKAQERAQSRPVEVPVQWTADALEKIEEDILRERPRGAEVRWWEETAVGHELDAVTKGPLGLSDEIAFVASGAAPIPRLAAHGVALRQYRRHPQWAFRDAATGALEPIYAVHYNEAAARHMGVPAAYDVGMQRTCWQIHLLTNWAGDHAWLKSVSGEYRSFVFLSEVVRFGGRVVEKFRDDDGDAVVRVETWGINQNGRNVMPGEAVIALSERGRPSPAARYAGRD
jgi:acyl dehydratase